MKIFELSDNCHHPQDSPTSGGQVLIYLILIMDFFSSLWTLYHHHQSREQLRVSYLSIILVFTWLLGYLLLATGATTSKFLTLHLLILQNFLTCRYFLISIWLIVVKDRLKGLPPSESFCRNIIWQIPVIILDSSNQLTVFLLNLPNKYAFYY